MSTAGQGQFVIGSYRVGQCIGEGTFGKVRLGVHVGTEERVAVKTLQKQKIVEQADIERVTRQICILKILRHPNIIQLYEIIETKTDIHLIMEYAPGGELFDYIVKKKRLDELESIAFMQQILSGVEYIHKNGIVHRDLKPQNLLFDEHRNIKIVDFGLSNQYKPGEKLKTACGSPCYAAPEMIAGKRYECLSVDIWSCGIILYAMLCGYLPFEDPNTNKLYKKIMSGDYEQPKVLTPDSKDMLRHILDVNPETRYKVNNIRESKWYNLIPSKYEAQGIVVGTDVIQPDDRIISAMRKMGVNMEPAQIRNYIINNRHNQITAFYYLLKKKADKNPSIIQNQTRPQEKEERRSNSPLMYKPEQKKEFYMPAKKSVGGDGRDTRVNDSFNASTIVSSLVEANKNKLISNINNGKGGKKIQTFDKTEQFKLFPKPKTNSVYQPSTAATTPISISINPLANNPRVAPSTTRTETQDKKYHFSAIKSNQLDNPSKTVELTDTNDRPQEIQFKPDSDSNIIIGQKKAISITKRQSSEQNGKKDEFQFKNKRREELSDQLKQISLKIDKEIQELRKHNNVGSTVSTNSEKRRQSFTYGMQPPSKLRNSDQTLLNESVNSATRSVVVTDRASFNKERPIQEASSGQERAQQKPVGIQKTAVPQQTPQPSQQRTQLESMDSSKINFYKQSMTKFPKMHFGPFNAQCLFMQAPRIIALKICDFLNRGKTVFKEVDSFTLRLQNNEVISVESIHGLGGYHIVKFSNYSAFADSIIDFLSQ